MEKNMENKVEPRTTWGFSGGHQMTLSTLHLGKCAMVYS